MKIELKTKEIISCPGAQSIRCGKGKIWITWPGGCDVILSENEKVLINNRGKIVIENVDRGIASISLE